MTDPIATVEKGDAASAAEISKDSDAQSINEIALGDHLPPGYFKSVQFIGMVIGFSLGVISSYVIFVMSTSVLTYTNADIGPSANIAWVSIARTLGQSITYLIQGRLSDLFGRRWFFIGGNLVALLGVIICAVAQNVNTLIIASAIYGIGECVQVSFGVAIGELVPNRVRPMIMSAVFFSSAPFGTFGPIIAKRFIQVGMGWRWNFYLGIIIIGLSIIMLYFFYKPPTFEMLHERKSKKAQLMELDYIGMSLWTSGLTLFLLGLSWGGGLFPWQSAAVISTIVIGAVVLIAFGFWEAYAPLRYPAMPIKLFVNRGFISLVACATVASMFYYSAILLWPQQVAAMYTTDPTYAGWLSCTVPAGVVMGQGIAGILIKYFKNTRYLIIASAVSMVAFVSGLAALTPSNINAGIALTIIGPFWVGFIEATALALAPLFCKPEDIGLASGMLASIRSAGGSIAVAVYSTILTNRLSTTLTSTVGGAAVEAGWPQAQIPGLVAAIKSSTWTSLPGMTSAVKSAVSSNIPSAYGQAFQTVYLASLAFGGIAIIGSLFTVNARELLTDKVERRMHGKNLGGEIHELGDKKLSTTQE